MDLLAIAPADVRDALRRLGKRNRAGHPLLQTRLVTRRLGDLGYPDTDPHRWWALGAVFDELILGEINRRRGAAPALSREDLRRWVVDERARRLLGHARQGGHADALVWAALYCQYILPMPAAADLPGLAGVHRRTWQRWLSDGYAVLLQALQSLEAETAGAGEPEPAIAPVPDAALHAMLRLERERLVGRAAEVEAVARHLRRDDVWLVTLAGPGGVGKTRVALAVAAALRADFPEEPTFVALSHLHDPGAVLASLAQRLAMPSADVDQLAEQLAARLCRRTHLMILDGFDHVIAAGPAIAAIAARCPSLKVLVTSREVLQVYGERVVTVAPLGVPGAGDLAASAACPDCADWVRRFPAVDLFVERAQAARHDFVPTGENLRAAGVICARLDGLPLAIELAARQLDVFSPRALARRITQALDLLDEGPRDQPEAQRSLQRTIVSSHDLLGAEERAVFRRLSVFSDGFTLDAAGQVCAAVGGPAGADILPVVRALIRKSLVHGVDDGDDEPRYGMLDTLREFGLARLAQAGEAGVAREAHAAAFCDLVEAGAGGASGGAAHGAWLARVDREYRNIQSALEWCLDGGASEVGVRLAVCMGDFWHLRGHIAEANYWLARAMALRGKVRLDPSLDLRLLGSAGRFLTEAGRHAEARHVQEECVPAAMATGDTRLIAVAHANLGVTALLTGEYRLADMQLRQALTRFQSLDDPSLVGRAQLNLAISASYAEDLGAARSWAQAALETYESAGDRVGIGRVLDVLAWVAMEAGDPDTAADLYRQSLEIARAKGIAPHLLPPLTGLANIAFARGDVASATEHWGETLDVCQATGQEALLAEPLSLIAAAVAVPLTRISVAPCAAAALPSAGMPLPQTSFTRLRAAIRLLAAAQAILDRTGHVLHPQDQRRMDRNMVILQASSPGLPFDAARLQGRALSTGDAYAEAVSALRMIRGGASAEPGTGWGETPPPASPADATPDRRAPETWHAADAWPPPAVDPVPVTATGRARLPGRPPAPG